MAPSDNLFTRDIFLIFVRKCKKIKIDYVQVALWRSSGGHHLDRLDRTMCESQRIGIPGESCTSLPRVNKTWVKFCLPALHFLMGRTKGKIGSFIAIRIRIHQKFASSMTPLWTLLGF